MKYFGQEITPPPPLGKTPKMRPKWRVEASLKVVFFKYSSVFLCWHQLGGYSSCWCCVCVGEHLLYAPRTHLPTQRVTNPEGIIHVVMIAFQVCHIIYNSQNTQFLLSSPRHKKRPQRYLGNQERYHRSAGVKTTGNKILK